MLSKFFEVTTLRADERFPDCCFIEDTAVVVPGTTVISLPGAQSRRGEEEGVKDALAANAEYKIHTIETPATLDGGDVLRVGSHLLAGISGRTNRKAVDQLSSCLGSSYTVQSVPVGAGLHLKSPMTALDDHTILYYGDAGRYLKERMKGLVYWRDMEYVEVPDFLAANVLLMGSNRVLMQGGLPASEHLVEKLCDKRGVELHKVPQMTEFAKADGALTCLSILW
jgi:dimethylargininase